MDNFDMDEYLLSLGIKSEAVLWDEWIPCGARMRVHRGRRMKALGITIDDLDLEPEDCC